MHANPRAAASRAAPRSRSPASEMVVGVCGVLRSERVRPPRLHSSADAAHQHACHSPVPPARAPCDALCGERPFERGFSPGGRACRESARAERAIGRAWWPASAPPPPTESRGGILARVASGTDGGAAVRRLCRLGFERSLGRGAGSSSGPARSPPRRVVKPSAEKAPNPTEKGLGLQPVGSSPRVGAGLRRQTGGRARLPDDASSGLSQRALAHPGPLTSEARRDAARRAGREGAQPSRQ